MHRQPGQCGYVIITKTIFLHWVGLRNFSNFQQPIRHMPTIFLMMTFVEWIVSRPLSYIIRSYYIAQWSRLCFVKFQLKYTFYLQNLSIFKSFSTQKMRDKFNKYIQGAFYLGFFYETCVICLFQAIVSMCVLYFFPESCQS